MNENEKQPLEPAQSVRGIRIITLNLFMLLVTLLLFCVVFYTTFRIAGDYRASLNATEDYIRWEKAAHALHVGSDYLTEQVRLYAETGDLKYAANYFGELYSSKSREDALEQLDGSGVMEGDKAAMQKALDLSNALTRKEIYAIRLVAEATGQKPGSIAAAVARIVLNLEDRELSPQDKMKRAREMLFSSEYGNAKSEIMTALAVLLENNLSRTREAQSQQLHGLGEMIATQRVALIALFLMNFFIFCMLLTLVIRPLRAFLRSIRQGRKLDVVGSYEFRNLAVTYNEIFSIKEQKAKMLKHKAEHDPLTGLMNRGAFTALVEMLRDAREPAGFLLVDVDKFKEVNDTYGHEMGDRTLCQVASLLQHNFRANDYCFRLGGDEFAVILRGARPEIAHTITEKIAAMNNSLQHPEGKIPPASVSVGGAFSEHGFSENLVNEADQALYEVKEHGRCGCAFFQGKSTES